MEEAAYYGLLKGRSSSGKLTITSSGDVTRDRTLVEYSLEDVPVRMSDGVENEERGRERVELESLWLDPASLASLLCSRRAGISSNDPVLGLLLLGGGGAPLMETIEKQDCWREIMALGRWLVELGLTRGTEEVPP